jgi:uncharacterized protein (TIGR02145 family)
MKKIFRKIGNVFNVVTLIKFIKLITLKCATFFQAFKIQNILKFIQNSIRQLADKIRNFILHPKQTFQALRLELSSGAPELSSKGLLARSTFHVSRFARWCWATLPRRIVSSVLIALFIITPIFNVIFVPKTQAAWWDDAWVYRKSIAVSNTSGATLTDFQVKILNNVDFSTTVGAGKMQASLNDLRFTDASGNLLSFWIEDATVSTVDAWVKLASIPTSGTIVYMYYGNKVASSGKGVVGGQAFPGLNCKAIQLSGVTTNGAYYVDPDGGNVSNAFQAYCDMTTDGGGWTLVAAAIGGDLPGSIWGGTGGIDIADASNGGRTFRFSDSTITTTRGISSLMRYTQSLGLSAYAVPPSVFDSTTSSAPVTFCESVTLTGTCYSGYSDGNTGPWGAYHGWIAASSTAVISGKNVCANKFGLSDQLCDSDHWSDATDWLRLWLGGNLVASNVSVIATAPGTEEKGSAPSAYWKFDEGQGIIANDGMGNNFTATGGTITEAGGYRIHTFLSSGTFTPTMNGRVEVLTVAGGGGGGGAGGGGGGGVIYDSSFAVAAGQTMTATVGGGGAGAGAGAGTIGANGTDSTFGSMVVLGGGGGGAYNGTGVGSGGSGGGGGSCNTTAAGSGKTGQGNAGGSGNATCSPYTSGGGGGAGSVGASASGVYSGSGGAGRMISIDGNNYYYGGGGGGGAQGAGQFAGSGGLGGGGGGAQLFSGTAGTGGGSARNMGGNGLQTNVYPPCYGGAGGANTGGGGGGMGISVSNGGAGGSGIIIVRYLISTIGTNFTATGGIVTEVDGYRIHTFLSGTSTFTPATTGNVEYLIVAGGGGGGGGSSDAGGGGGGGGGYRTNVFGSVSGGGSGAEAVMLISAGSYNVVVGSGGAGRVGTTAGSNGGTSSFNGIVSLGGGVAGQQASYAGVAGASGGGGGGGDGYGVQLNTAGAGTANQGFAGGRGGHLGGYWLGGGGGGGASAAGADVAATQGGAGGNGVSSVISGSAVIRGGGGGGSINTNTGVRSPGAGGAGGGGVGGYTTPAQGGDGSVNTGGGGGGGSHPGTISGGSGGSGIVIIRYPIPIVNNGVLTNIVSPATATSGWQNGSSCVSGKCLALDGTNDFVSLSGGNLPKGSDARTLSMWINPASVAIDNMGLFGYGTEAASQSLYVSTCTGANANKIKIGKYGTDASACSTGTISVNTWQQISVTLDTAGNVVYYINGKNAGTATLAGVSTVANNLGYIGKASATGTTFNGKLDEVKVFSYVRTSDQQKLDYNAGKSGAATANGTSVSMGGKQGMEDAWWNNDWRFRKAVAITNSSGSALTYFQVKILNNVDFSTAVGAGKMQSSLNDLRFTDVSGNLLPYWIEDATVSSADAWVKLASIPTAGATVYMYYGNAGASTNSDPTFLPKSCSEVNVYSGSGAYYLNPDGGSNPFQAYCDMTNEGGGWTLVMRMANDGGLGYAATTYWTNGTLLNQSTVDATTNTNAVFSSYNTVPGKTIRGCKGASTSCISGTTTFTSARALFSGAAQYFSIPRATWIATFPPDDTSQPNCSQNGINVGGIYASGRFSMQGNNEADCITVDSEWGWGISGTGHTCGAGNVHWDAGGASYVCSQGTLWVRNVAATSYAIIIAAPSAEEKGTAPSAYWKFDEGQGIIANDSIGTNFTATGGTITEAGGYRIHTFTSTGTFTPSSAGSVEVFAWGAGGAGGTAGGWVYGAAGGAGGAAQAIVTVSVGDVYPVVIGGGGGVNSYNAGLLTCSTGGGACASWNNSDNRYGSGSGGYSGVFKASISQTTALLIAGGGGGGGSSRAGTGNSGGAGGGLTGQVGYSPYDGKAVYGGNPGTQSAAGADASCVSANTTGGQGALQGGRSMINSYGGAGGGGYWGGSGGGYSEANTMGGGGGGSSFANPAFARSAVLTSGTDTAPGNQSNLLRGTAGNAGAVGAAGSNGVVIIRYPISQSGTLTNIASPATATSGWQNGSSCVSGKCLALDGTNDFVSLNGGNLPMGSDARTLSMWINPASVAIDNMGLFGYGTEAASQSLYVSTCTGANANKIKIGKYGTDASACSTGTISANTWQQISVTLDTAGNVVYYINGKNAGTATLAGVSTVSNNLGYIGKASSTGVTFNGKIDEVKVFPYVLNASQLATEINLGSSVLASALVSTDLSAGTSSEYCVPGDASACNPPIAEWRMDENTGTVANDTSGNNNTGTLTNGPIWDRGKFGSGVKFDGSNDYVSLGSPSNFVLGTSDFSVSAWVKLSVMPTSDAWPASYSSHFVIVGLGTFNLGDGWDLIVGQTKIILQSNDAQIISGTHSMTTNTWYNIAVKRLGSNFYLYVNGFQIASISSSVTMGTGAVANIGCETTQGAFLNGSIDQVRIYNYARTPAQIAWDYNKGGPVGWWKMDECQGTTINDASGNANNGTLTVGSGGTTSAGTCTASSTAWGSGVTGKFGSSLSFDGTDDYVDIPSNSNYAHGTGDFTWSVWINGKSFASGNNYIIDRGGGNTGAISYYNSVLRYYNSTTGGSALYTTGFGTNLSTNAWYHAVVRRKDGVTYLYLNGTLSTSAVDSYSYIAQAIRLGNYGGGGNYYWNGQIDDVRVYNYALTKEQIANVMNEGSSLRFGAPSAYVITTPANTAVPTILGAAMVGATLTATTGSWTGYPTPTFTYQWQRGVSNIGGATNSTYVAQAADGGSTLRVVVTGTNSVGNATGTSANTSAVTMAPANTAIPTISGTATVGATLTATTGSWTGYPTPTYTYQWQRGTTAISGATNSTYVAQAADGGSTLRVVVTGTNSAGNATGTSANTSAVPVPFVCGTSTVAGAGSITYGTVVGADGKCWLDRNLGAPNVATAFNNSANYGYYYQWGRGTDGHQIATSGTTSTLSSSDAPGHGSFILAPSAPNDWRSGQNNNLWQGVSGINNPCPTGFRIPTQSEWAALVSAAGITNYSTAWSSTLKLTAAGRRSNAGSWYNVGSNGFYWSSSPSGTRASNLYFYSTFVSPAYANYRANGFSVRCVKD